MLVSERDKQTDLASLVKTAAERYREGLTLETHHRLASEGGAVSPRDRDRVMGEPNYYCEILPVGSPTDSEFASGQTQAVAHAFDIFLVYQFEEHSQYSGSTQQAFDLITEGLDPLGVLPGLRKASVRQIGGVPVTYRPPEQIDKDIVGLGQRGGSLDRAHRLQSQITLVEPS